MNGEPFEADDLTDDQAVAEPAGPDHSELRMVEALLFAASEPLSVDELHQRLPGGTDVGAALMALRETYATRGVNLVQIGGKWCFRTAEDLAFLMHKQVEEQRKLSRAALETLAIIAYHQPVTRAEIEEIRGVSTSKGTLDVLMETSWIRMRGRRRTPGRPVTYGTSEQFLQHFSLDTIKDLPGLEELKGAGLLDSAIPATFIVPIPSDDPALSEDEDPLEEDLADMDAGEEIGMDRNDS